MPVSEVPGSPASSPDGAAIGVGAASGVLRARRRHHRARRHDCQCGRRKKKPRALSARLPLAPDGRHPQSGLERGVAYDSPDAIEGAAGVSGRVAASIAHIRLLAPGVLALAAIAGLARGLSLLLQGTISEVFIALLIGLVIFNTVGSPVAVAPGASFGMRTLLRAGIVLLGARLSFEGVLAVGIQSLLFVLTGVCGRRCRRPAGGVPAGAHPSPGDSARGRDRHLRQLSDHRSPARSSGPARARWRMRSPPSHCSEPWPSSSTRSSATRWPCRRPRSGPGLEPRVNDTGQVVATGYAYGTEAGDVATVVKLTRNLLIGARS